MSKTGYHWMVWILIFTLLTVAILIYLYAISMVSSGKRIKKDHEYLRREFESHKDRSRENQVKLKRELQTAVNTIEELKKGKISR